MHQSPLFSARRILIVKTSSLGDIIQSFVVLHYLKEKFPDAEIDWAVEKRFASIVEAHPLVSRAIAFDKRELKDLVVRAAELRRFKYDVVFDLQGNCKSAVLTLLSRSSHKVGFGIHSVREWPNILATKVRYEVPSTLNIRLQLISLIQQFLKDDAAMPQGGFSGVRFKISNQEQSQIDRLLSSPEAQTKERIMVCPGSKWINKQLPRETLSAFLSKIDSSLNASFFLMWGDAKERTLCEELQRQLPGNSLIVERLELPVWQNLMNEMSVVIALDSGALHLCGTTSAPSFSLFGPTMPEIFKPIGSRHLAMRGACPYLKTFEKQCPLLRTCSTGACIRNLEAEEIFNRFLSWWQTIVHQSRCASPQARSLHVP
jgi:heptosyltransferase-1